MTLPPEDDALAAEIALGLLEGEERAAALARLKVDPALARAVEAWEARLSPLNEGFTPVPAPNLMPRIEARLFPQPPRRSLRLWAMAGAGAGSLAVLALAAFIAFAPVAPPVITEMAVADGPAYRAVFDGQRLTVTRTAGQAAPEGHVHELWIIAPGAAPVSLGLLQAQPLVVAYPTPPAGWVLAVSVEPAGGAPGGQPTGPVVMTGEIEM